MNKMRDTIKRWIINNPKMAQSKNTGCSVSRRLITKEGLNQMMYYQQSKDGLCANMDIN
jgi:hypothetical protein